MPPRPRSTRGPQLLLANGAVFTFDAGTSETYSDEVTVTQHPVEEGIDVADHSQPMPLSVTWVMLMTNSPLHSPHFPNRDVALYDVLRNIQAERQPMTLVSNLRVCPNMILTKIDVPRTPDIGQAVQATLEFKEVRFTRQLTTAIPPAIVQERAKRKGHSCNKGRQNADDVGKPGEEPPETAASLEGSAGTNFGQDPEDTQAANPSTPDNARNQSQSPEAKKAKKKNSSTLFDVFGNR